jgi:hypothetical protein
MHAVIRTYSGRGAGDLFDRLEERKSDVDRLMRSIQGFIAYDLVRTDSGGASITVCQNKGGTDESARRAREWIATNASDIQAEEPAVAEGPVIVHVEAQPTAAMSASSPVLASS